MPPHSLPLSRMLACGGTLPPGSPSHVNVPLGGALTWDPVHGHLPHATPELAALHVVQHNATHGFPDSVEPVKGRPDPFPLRARILCVSETVCMTESGLPGLSSAHERRLLTEARALLAAAKA